MPTIIYLNMSHLRKVRKTFNIFNLLCLIMAVSLLLLGVADVASGSLYQDDLNSKVVAIVGIIMVVTCILGFVGVDYDCPRLVYLYTIVIFIMLVFQAFVAVVRFLVAYDPKQLDITLRPKYEIMFRKYNESKQSREKVDKLQSYLECCGLDSPEEWRDNVPASCYYKVIHKHKSGCLKVLNRNNIYFLNAIGVIYVVSGILELVAAAMAIILYNQQARQP